METQPLEKGKECAFVREKTQGKRDDFGRKNDARRKGAFREMEEEDW
jgi:hypothetical protein